MMFGCSTMNRSMTYGGIVGGVAGGFLGGSLGKTFSPDKKSEAGNTLLWGGFGTAIGGLGGAYLGKYFYGEDPDNKPLKQMIIDEKKEEIDNVNLETSGLEKLLKDSKVAKQYNVPIENLPAHLKNRVCKPRLIEYEIPERQELNESGNPVYIDEGKAYELYCEE